MLWLPIIASEFQCAYLSETNLETGRYSCRRRCLWEQPGALAVTIMRQCRVAHNVKYIAYTGLFVKIAILSGRRPS